MSKNYHTGNSGGVTSDARFQTEQMPGKRMTEGLQLEQRNKTALAMAYNNSEKLNESD